MARAFCLPVSLHQYCIRPLAFHVAYRFLQASHAAEILPLGCLFLEATSFTLLDPSFAGFKDRGFCCLAGMIAGNEELRGRRNPYRPFALA